jgi:hypothetical protein
VLYAFEPVNKPVRGWRKVSEIDSLHLSQTRPDCWFRCIMHVLIRRVLQVTHNEYHFRRAINQ